MKHIGEILIDYSGVNKMNEDQVANTDQAAPKSLHKDEPNIDVVYRCTNSRCKAETILNFKLTETPYQVINCWRCHAGYNVSLQEQIATQTGMFPVRS